MNKEFADSILGKSNKIKNGLFYCYVPFGKGIDVTNSGYRRTNLKRKKVFCHIVVY